jgi:hypothetical protein
VRSNEGGGPLLVITASVGEDRQVPALPRILCSPGSSVWCVRQQLMNLKVPCILWWSNHYIWQNIVFMIFKFCHLLKILAIGVWYLFRYIARENSE